MSLLNLFFLPILLFVPSFAENGAWVAKSPMPTSRSDFLAITIGDDIILAGGCDSAQLCPSDLTFCYCPSITNKTEAYRPKTNDWISLADMPIPRYRHAAASVGQKMYLFGGRDINDVIIPTVDVFDSVSNTWQTLPDVWPNATSDAVAATVGNRIYVLSGYTQDYQSVGNVSVLDVSATPTWVNIGSTSSMNQARGDACAVEFNNKIYVFGGFSDINFCVALDTLEVYDPVKNQWETEAPLHLPRGDCACGVQHSLFHAIGGEQKNNVSGCNKYDIPIHDVESYDPTANSWTEESPLPDDRYRFAGATWSDHFFVFGGQAAYNDFMYAVLNEVEAWQDLSNVSATTGNSETSTASYFGAEMWVYIFASIALLFAKVGKE